MLDEIKEMLAEVLVMLRTRREFIDDASRYDVGANEEYNELRKIEQALYLILRNPNERKWKND